MNAEVLALNKKINIGSENNKWVLVDDIIFFKEKNQKLNKNIFLRKVDLVVNQK